MNAMEVQSTNFIKNTLAMSFIEQKLSPARDLLLNRIFLGRYEERRYVVQLKEYRDVVTISSAELQLKTDLDIIIKDLKAVDGIKWLGITLPESHSSKLGYSFWVKLINVPFGSFWFQIRQIKYEHGEIILRLKCLRPVKPEDYEVAHKDTIPKSGDSNNSEDRAEYSFDFNPGLKLTMLYATLNETIQQVRPHLTWNNFVLLSKFVFAVVFVLISALLTTIRYGGDYFLRLVREIILLLNVLTPVFVKAIDCFTKIIGGVFILIALMIKGRESKELQKQLQPQQETISYPQRNLLQLMPAHPVQRSGFSANNPVIIPSNWKERNQNLKMEFLR